MDNSRNIVINNNNNTTTIGNINIQLNAYGHESISHIMNDTNFLNRCFMTLPTGFVKLIEKHHCDPAHPENMNVKVPNKREAFIDVYEGPDRGWATKVRDAVLDEMINNSTNILHEHLVDHEEEMRRLSSAVAEKTISYFNEFRHKLNSEIVDKVMKDVRKKVYASLLTHSRQVA